MAGKESIWHVYIMVASDGTLYTGITTDLARRWRQHRRGGGAKYLRGRRPVAVAYIESQLDHRTAAQREIALKRLRRPAKLALLGLAGAPAPLRLSHALEMPGGRQNAQ